MPKKQSTKQPAVLLIGPTGSGKTPLGAELERRGWAGRRCVHFDFGAELRAAAARSSGDGLSGAERSVIVRVLASGALLKEEEFPIALKIFRRFVGRRGLGRNDWIVLNGLPRHFGQALGLDEAVDVRRVIILRAEAGVVRDRIQINSGGDRFDRVDDRPDEIGRKLSLFAERTKPLIDRYANRGAAVLTIEIDVRTTAAEMADEVLKKISR